MNQQQYVQPSGMANSIAMVEHIAVDSSAAEQSSPVLHGTPALAHVLASIRFLVGFCGGINAVCSFQSVERLSCNVIAKAWHILTGRQPVSKRERGFYIFSQPTRLYRCARVASNLVKNISTKRLSCLNSPK